jgi:DNA-directed RNA polymerase subunit F
MRKFGTVDPEELKNVREEIGKLRDTITARRPQLEEQANGKN